MLLGLGLCAFLGSVLLTGSCNDKSLIVNDEDTIPGNELVVYDYSVSNLERSQKYQRNIGLGGKISSNTLIEASGIVQSRSNPYILWSHNDSGYPNRIFALGSKGEDYGTFSITGAGSRDYEDIAIGAGPVDGVNYLYIADIGDNDEKYSYVVIYRFPEPDVSGLDSLGMNTIPENQLARLEFEYPDGAVNAETLMLDPWTKDLYIVSKSGYRSILYRAKYPQSTTSRTMLEKLAQFPFTGATAGDISPDGTQIVIKDKTRIFYWQRTAGQSVVDAMKTAPKLLPYIPEPQGEAIGWHINNKGFFTLSEKNGIPQPELYFYGEE